MSKQIFYLVFFIFSIIMLNCSSAKAQLILRAGTPVSILLKEGISDPLLVNNTTVFRIEATIDVSVNNKVVIATHSTGEAVVTNVKKVKKERRFFYEITIEAKNIRSVDNQTIDLFADPITIVVPANNPPSGAGLGTRLTATVLNTRKIND